MSSAVMFENSFPPSNVGDAPVPHVENQLMAMCMIYALLNQAMGEGVKVQGEMGTSLSKAQDKVTESLKVLNDNIASLKESIQNLQNNMKDIQPWLTALTIVSVALGVGATGVAFVGASLESVGAATVAGVIKTLGSLAGVASGVLSIVEGSYSIKQGSYSEKLAPISGDASLASGAQKNYQVTSKTVIAEIGESMSRITSLAQSMAKDINAINEGLRAANRDILQGVLGNYR